MPVTVADIATWMEEKLPNKSETVDQLLFGDPNQQVKKVAVTFMASVETLKKAKDYGANLLICHESPYYDHHHPDLHQKSVIMQEKMKLLQDIGIAIYRNHDSVHRQHPDLITAGLVRALEWEDYMVGNDPIQTSVQIPETSLEAILLHIKDRLKVKHVRYVGKKTNKISNVSLSVGYRGSGANVIPLLEQSMGLVKG